MVLGENVEIAAVQKGAKLVELDKCCQTHIYLQKIVLIQPRTSPPKNCKILLIFPNCLRRCRRGGGVCMCVAGIFPNMMPDLSIIFSDVCRKLRKNQNPSERHLQPCSVQGWPSCRGCSGRSRPRAVSRWTACHQGVAEH